MNKPRLGLKRVPIAPSTRFPDQGPEQAVQVAVHLLELGLTADDFAEVPEVVAEKGHRRDHGGGQEPEEASGLGSRHPQDDDCGKQTIDQPGRE